MTDMILVVEDAAKFHRENYKMNPSHYACLPRIAAYLQDFGAGVYYNTNISIPRLDKLDGYQAVKYGIISRDRFLSDLEHWDTLYIAGRLHKPVIDMTTKPGEIEGTITMNQRHASLVARLCLGSNFTLFEYLAKIVGLSYLGDFRMGIAEDPKKIQRIVEGQADLLWKIYKSLMGDVTKVGPDSFAQDPCPRSRRRSMEELPSNLKRRLDIENLVANPNDISPMIERRIAQIVRRPAMVQAAKGIISAGPLTAIQYSFTKLMRRFT